MNVDTADRPAPDTSSLLLPPSSAMELKVWVDGVVRVVCGLSEETSCQDVVIALAQAIGECNSAELSALGHRPDALWLNRLLFCHECVFSALLNAAYITAPRNEFTANNLWRLRGVEPALQGSHRFSPPT